MKRTDGPWRFSAVNRTVLRENILGVRFYHAEPRCCNALTLTPGRDVSLAYNSETRRAVRAKEPFVTGRTIALLAVSIALVAAIVASVPVPIPATGGFTHPGAVAEVFVALAFGPVVGMVASGVGAAIADLALGFGAFAPLTLVAHGVLGFLVGLIGWRRGLAANLAGWALGGLGLVLIYYLGEATLYGFGPAAALTELPINLFQVGLGVLGLVLYRLVRAAYPAVDSLASDPVFERVE